MRAILGIDAAWTSKHPSGVALIAESKSGWECLAVAPSYAAFINLSKGIPVDWSGRFQGSAPSANELLDAAKNLLWSGDVVLVAVDMPLSTIPITSRRVADDAVSKHFGSKKCGTHSPSPERPGKMSDDLSARFMAANFPLATISTVSGTTKRLLEVYPHPALITLLSLEERLEYKVSKSRTYWPNERAESRRMKLLSNFNRVLAALENEIDSVDLHVPLPQGISALSALKPYEDAIDALVCAWVGMRFLDGRAIPYGNDEAAIWIPR